MSTLTQTITGKKTMSSVLYEKFVEYVETKTLDEIAMFVFLSFASGVLSSFALDGGVLVRGVMSWNNGAVPLVIMMSSCVFALPWIAKKTLQVLRDFNITREEEDDTDMTEIGISASEILDYLFSVKTFKREDVENRFAIPRYRYTELVKKMKEGGVLVAGENNQSVLAEGITREHAANVILGRDEEVRVVVPSSAPFFKKSVIK